MNIVNILKKRDEGFEAVIDYDIALHRMKCYRDDVYGISPTTQNPDFNPEPPVFVCRFSTTEGHKNILALANEDGKIALQDITKKQENNGLLEGTQAHWNAIFDIDWMPGEMKLITASGDHSARLWDVSSSDYKIISEFKAHTRSLKTAVFRPNDKAVFATGARDGDIMVWDIRAKHGEFPKPDNCIFNGHSFGNLNKHRRSSHLNSRTQSITALAFQDENTMLSCSSGDGLIKAWDLRKNYTVHKKDPIAKHAMKHSGRSTKNGFTTLLVSDNGNMLYTNCMDNIIYAYNIASYDPQPVAEYYGHLNSSFYVKSCLSPDGKYLASGSSDGHAYIWKIKQPGIPIIRLTGHTEEVACVAWCPVGEPRLVTCSDDGRHSLWKIGKEEITDDDKLNIQGEAEILTPLSFSNIRQSVLETTPTVSDRRNRTILTPNSDVTPEAPIMDYRTQSLERLAKRSRDILERGSWTDGKYKTILSPIAENFEPAIKRACIERGARRLFSPMHTQSLDYESDGGAGPSSTSPSDKPTPFSPTLNLPNFVIDGTAPHLLQVSPQKSKENIDWLTKIRNSRYERKTNINDNDHHETTPAKRGSRSRSTESRKNKSPSVSLLKFFKRGSSVETEDKICSNNSDHNFQRDSVQ